MAATPAVKVFVSSVITGFEAERDAAAAAVISLGHAVIRSEHFGARVESPQTACLQGVREADVVVLVLGARYGALQPSGLSASHEEFREARERKPVLLFVQDGVDREEKQEAFAKEVRAWASGGSAASFRTAAELATAVTRDLHRYELANATGSVNGEELEARARATIPRSRPGTSPALHLAVAPGPAQQVVRPADLESDALYRELAQLLQFGPTPVFDPEGGAKRSVREGGLVISQDDRHVALDGSGTFVTVLPITGRTRQSFGLVIVEEDVRDTIKAALELTGLVYEQIDATGRITDVVPVTALVDAQHVGWQTRAEHEASAGRYSISMRGTGAGEGVTLTPALIRRASLRHDSRRIAEDLTVLLRRHVKK